MSHLVEKQLPFSCQPVAADASCDSGEAMNQLVFALLECIGDGINLLPAKAVESDIERVEHKLNLVIFMLNNLTQPTQTRPAPKSVRLGADNIAWQADTPISQGQSVLIEVYLDPMISIPLTCCGRVIEQQDGWCTAALTGLTEEGMTIWSRWVFRQHRQFVAHSREHDPLQPG